MISARGNIARKISAAYLSLTLAVVLVSAISIGTIWHARKNLVLETNQKNTVALLSARIRSDALSLTNSIQHYLLVKTGNKGAERDAINKQIAALDALLNQAIHLVDTDDLEETIAIGSIRQYMTAFNVQSRKVLDTADGEGGFGLETERQMDILFSHYQPMLIKSLEEFEKFESDSARQTLLQAEKYAFHVSVILSVVSILAILFDTVVSFWFSKRFIAPLTALTENVRMHPDRSVETPIEIDTPDEMGDLARALNRMKTEIKDAQNKLEQYAETLEAKVEERTHELKLLAITDPLTGIYNRGHFFALANQMLLEARRMNYPFSVAIIDIDHFKNVNDRFGHAAGDHALRQVTAVMQAQIRQMDVIGRYGGEEFVLALPAANRTEALLIGERIVAAVRDAQMIHESHAFNISISCGIASRNGENETLENILQKADESLYKAKEAGRDRAVAENNNDKQGEIT